MTPLQKAKVRIKQLEEALSAASGSRDAWKKQAGDAVAVAEQSTARAVEAERQKAMVLKESTRLEATLKIVANTLHEWNDRSY